MRWDVAMITAPRPTRTIERSLHSLYDSGFPCDLVQEDTDESGSWPTWFAALSSLLESDADALLIVEDDAIFCKGLRGYLESTLWPDSECALCSAYSCGKYTERPNMSPGWSQMNNGHFLVGSLCWAIPRKSAEAIRDDLYYSRFGRRNIDLRIGLWALDTGRSVWYHKPSLVQHIGSGNSALGRGDQSSALWHATDFIGEDTEPTQGVAE